MRVNLQGQSGEHERGFATDRTRSLRAVRRI